MPELPEVEVTRLGLLPHLLEQNITAVFWSGKQLRLPMPVNLLDECICGSTVIAIDRRAKYLLIRMNNASVLMLHLGMTGRLGIFPRATARATHDHLGLLLNNGLELRLHDARRFGSVTVWPSKQAAQLEEAFSLRQGLEPFGPDFTAANLARLAGQRKQPVKTFLMDARQISGIGNIYANETLFAAGVHPQVPVNLLNAEQWQRITTCAVAILNRAIAAGGSTISDFLGSSGQAGHFQLQFAVYGKKDQPCPVCGQKIHRENLGGRATFFCLACQPLSAVANLL
ncbi:bifunctional DNA-formamidopyrimidine glycosylase/DNA-(apurinic or apyrimidinic site) lyase [Candidatus Electronema sp. PJ]|uniref:bifunctional DNA-formamidopyrimidine glycosylase/DNA-(apurinic or apyrimidinic site) lyase n=1 Tax=Candidatus Electronema sp. PJ TaxID=3401572 RepID=UPI003AA9D6A3